MLGHVRHPLDKAYSQSQQPISPGHGQPLGPGMYRRSARATCIVNDCCSLPPSVCALIEKGVSQGICCKKAGQSQTAAAGINMQSSGVNKLAGLFTLSSHRNVRFQCDAELCCPVPRVAIVTAVQESSWYVLSMSPMTLLQQLRSASRALCLQDEQPRGR